MHEILLSVQPKWCELIASGKKTLEVRKTKPKIKIPFKVYIYCTNPSTNNPNEILETHSPWGKIYRVNGKVLGEFVCDGILVDETYGHNPAFYSTTCMSAADIAAYCCQPLMYGWHISELKIYDEPKPLEKFRKACKYRSDGSSCQWRKVECDYVKFDFNPDGSVNLAECCDYMSRPPMSWCYVEVSE